MAPVVEIDDQRYQGDASDRGEPRRAAVRVPELRPQLRPAGSARLRAGHDRIGGATADLSDRFPTRWLDGSAFTLTVGQGHRDPGSSSSSRGTSPASRPTSDVLGRSSTARGPGAHCPPADGSACSSHPQRSCAGTGDSLIDAVPPACGCPKLGSRPLTCRFVTGGSPA
jgi:hypothetical protein